MKKLKKRYIYYYRCTKTCKYDWKSCRINYGNANKVEEFITEKLTKNSEYESTIEKLVKKINKDEEQKASSLRKKRIIYKQKYLNSIRKSKN